MKKYDAIIIGSGQAGTPLAKTFSAQGLKVAIVEKEYPGGSCVNWGCTPTKTMVASAAVSHLAKTSSEVGIDTSNVVTNFAKVRGRRDELVEKSRKSVATALEDDENINLLYGEASFKGAHIITVEPGEGKEAIQLEADKVFINTGASPMVPDLKGLKEVKYYTSKTIMNLEELPGHLIILGGSYIGLEFGQMYRRLGSQVTIIEQGKQLASKEDDDIAQYLLDTLQEEGIQVILEAEAGLVSTKAGKLELALNKPDNKTITGTHLLLAVGTTPNTDALQLHKAGVEVDKKGYIEVNNVLETNVKGIYALGDCKGGPEFTHISYDDYRIVKDHLFGNKKRSVDDRPLPYTMFTKPELGRIGLNEKQAREQNVPYKLASMPMKHVARANEANQTRGIVKVLVDPDSKQILGAACLSENGGEMMSMLQIAMMGQIPYTRLRDAMFAHPTYAEMFNKLFEEIKDPTFK